MAVDEVPTVGAGEGGGALPGKVVAHPVNADVQGSPSPSTLPYHGTAIHLSIQRSLRWYVSILRWQIFI